MRKESYLFYIAICFSLLLTYSCQSYDEGMYSGMLEQGQFVMKYPKEYTVSMTRGVANQRRWTRKMPGMEMEITESNWSGNNVNQTRSSIIGDEIDWEEAPSVGLYISDLSGSMKIKNVPLDPVKYVIYDHCYDESKRTSSNDTLFDSIKAENISSASFFWKKWSQLDKVSTDGANFYGIYPRPFDHLPAAEYNYTRNSVINSSSVNNDNNSISYLFWEAQTDKNIKQFDLMYSKSENTTEYGVYGNQNKKEGESILMRFAHAFSLLNIEIYKGTNYTGTGLLSAISVKGTDVSTTGELNYVTGKLTKGTDEGVVNRTITESLLSVDAPFQTEIIVPPSSDDAIAVEGKDKISIVCKIDGNEYKYRLPDDVKLRSGMKYNIKLTLSPSGLSQLNVWYGAKVILDSDPTPLEYGSKMVSGNETFTVSGVEGYTIDRIVKNGEIIGQTPGTFNLEKNCTYNIVAHPTNNWYAMPESIRVQFDGIMNTAYKTSQNKDVSIWQDFSGNGNDGNLKSFNGTAESGWNDKNGLVFDGVDDIVIFPGNINATEYTMEFFLAFDKQKSNATPRLNAEGTAYPAYYLRRMSSDGKWHIGLFGHNCSQFDSDVSIEDDKTLVQLDMVYKDKIVRFYKNGEYVDSFVGKNQAGYTIDVKDAVSIPEASLGNRSADNTRTTTGTYYSYILYDKELSLAQIQKNYEINKLRFK